MECTFQVGDRVVCVDNAALPGVRGSVVGTLQVGAIYTVRKVALTTPGRLDSGHYDPGGIPVLKLAEVPDRRRNDEGFAADRFRRVKPISFWLGEKQTLTVEA